MTIRISRRSKYGNRRTTVDGLTFHSRKEARRYAELRLLEKAGNIFDLELQPAYALNVNGITIATYFADFRYKLNDEAREAGMPPQVVVEDVKGVKTQVYLMKKRLMKAVHNITILET